MVDVSLSVCFKLGRALRYGDAGAFFEVYDSYLKEETTQVDKLSIVKEFARQISELGQEDFILLHTACHTSSAACRAWQQQQQLQVSHSVEEQLTACLERLRLDGTSCTSDSGAVSDFDGSVSCDDTNSLQSSSTSALLPEDHIAPDWQLISKEREESNSVQQPLEKESFIELGDRSHPATEAKKMQVSNIECDQLLHVKGEVSVEGHHRDMATIVTPVDNRPSAQQTERSSAIPSNHRSKVARSRGSGSTSVTVSVRNRRSNRDNTPEQGGGRRRRGKVQQTISRSHQRLAQFLWRGWQQAQRELQKL